MLESWGDDEIDSDPKREQGILCFLSRSRFGFVFNQRAVKALAQSP